MLPLASWEGVTPNVNYISNSPPKITIKLKSDKKAKSFDIPKKKLPLFRWWPRPYTPRKCMNVNPTKGSFQSSKRYFSGGLLTFGDWTLPLLYSNFRRGFLPLKFHGIGIYVQKTLEVSLPNITLPWRFLIGVFCASISKLGTIWCRWGFFFHPNKQRWRTWEAEFLALMGLSLPPNKNVPLGFVGVFCILLIVGKDLKNYDLFLYKTWGVNIVMKETTSYATGVGFLPSIAAQIMAF